jgi:tetratricopeptide (TPR) repeat protein
MKTSKYRWFWKNLGYMAAALCTCVLSSCISVGAGASYTMGNKSFAGDYGLEDNRSVAEFGGRVFADFEYTELTASYIRGSLETYGQDIGYTSYNAGFFIKYPFRLFKDRLTIAPKLGWEVSYQDPGHDLLDFYWFKVGVNIDYSLSRYFYLRGEALYDPNLDAFSDLPPLWGFFAGIGFRLENDPIRENYQTFAQMKAQREQRERDELLRQAQRERDEILSQARSALDNKEYQQAAELFTRLIEGESVNWEYYRGRARAYWGAGSYAEALKDFNESLGQNALIGDRDYTLWKDIVMDYEKAYNLPASTLGRGMWRLTSRSYTLANINEVFKNIKTSGSANTVSLPAGEYTFRLNWKSGDWYINNIERTEEIKPGRVYELKSEETIEAADKRSLRTWIEEITDAEIPATVKFTLADIGDRIDEDRYDCINRNSRGDGVYTWVPKGFPGTRERVKLDQLNLWDAVTLYTGPDGTVTGRDFDYEFRFDKSEGSYYAEQYNTITPNLRRTTAISYIVFSDRFKEEEGAVHKDDGTYNGRKANMYISPGGAHSAIFWEDENKDRVVMKVIQRTGIIPGIREQ